MENTFLYLSTVTAFLIVLILSPILIPMLKQFKFGQNVRDDGPESHLKKQGTPTMGGIMMIIAIIIGSISYSGWDLKVLTLVLAVTLYGIIGFADDYIKVRFKRSLGLTAKQKLIGQFAFGLIVTLAVYFLLGKDTKMLLPFVQKEVDLSYLWIPFGVFIMMAATNAVNLTDGLDGLASSVCLVLGVFYSFYVIRSGAGELSIFSGALAGATLGFLVFNHYPAKVFMGDTGSLALGAGLGALSLMTKTALFLPFIGIIIVAETVSVMIQVASFKMTGKRVFKMAPLHHHFELSGWSEVKVCLVFALITVLACVLVYIF